jgi:hypothetical protein
MGEESNNGAKPWEENPAKRPRRKTYRSFKGKSLLSARALDTIPESVAVSYNIGDYSKVSANDILKEIYKLIKLPLNDQSFDSLDLTMRQDSFKPGR